MKKEFILAILLSTIFAGAVGAAPDNIVVDTSQASSGKLTISGTGFGATSANVIMYDKFESSTALEGGFIPLTSPDIGIWTAHGGSNNQYPPLYNTNSRSGEFGAQMYTNGMRQFKLSFGVGIQEIFLSYWVRLPNSQIFPGNVFPDGRAPEVFPSDSSWKFTWIYDLDVGGNSSDLCLPTHVGSSGIFYLGGNDFNLDTAVGNRETWWSWDSWMRVSVWLRAHPSDPLLDGDVLFQTISAEKGLRDYKVSKPIFDADFANGVGEQHEGLPDIKQYQHINFPGWIDPDTQVGTTPIYDDIYVAIGASSQVRVELMDSPIYEDAKEVAIQKVVSWSDTEIEINIVEDNFGKGLQKPAYIFVWDKDGNRNQQGKPVFRYPRPPSDISLAE